MIKNTNKYYYTNRLITNKYYMQFVVLWNIRFLTMCLLYFHLKYIFRILLPFPHAISANILKFNVFQFTIMRIKYLT